MTATLCVLHFFFHRTSAYNNIMYNAQRTEYVPQHQSYWKYENTATRERRGHRHRVNLSGQHNEGG